MPDRKKIIENLQIIRTWNEVGKAYAYDEMDKKEKAKTVEWIDDTLELLKEQESLLGIQQTADGITFISTGTAQQGEARGLLLGKMAMHEWLEKELLYRGLLTDDIRAVFDEAKQQ